MITRRGIVALSAALALGACSPEPVPIRFGEDACETCLMGISDERFAAEAVTRTGKIHTFDSAECLAAFVNTTEEDLHSVWVSDFGNPDAGLISAENAFFLMSPTLPSPMGLGISAFGRVEDRDGGVNAFGGVAATWTDVRVRVAEKWPNGSPHAGRHGWQEGRP